MEELDRMLRDLDVELEKLRSFKLPEDYQEVKFIDEEQMEVKIKLAKGAVLPKYAKQGDAGMDLHGGVLFRRGIYGDAEDAEN